MRRLQPGIGAAVGTGVHAGACYQLEVKMKTGEIGDLKESIEVGIVTLRDETKDGTTYDATTGNMNDAERQIGILVNAYREQVAPGIMPAGLEIQRAASLNNIVEVSGRTDVETIEGDLGDTKTGSRLQHYGAQLGGYSLLRRSNGAAQPRLAFIDYLPRVPVKKAFPGACRFFYDVNTCESQAFGVIKGIVAAVKNFEKTGDPWAFGANPMSAMCSDKYCPAYGTQFCDLTTVNKSVSQEPMQ